MINLNKPTSSDPTASELASHNPASSGPREPKAHNTTSTSPSLKFTHVRKITKDKDFQAVFAFRCSVQRGPFRFSGIYNHKPLWRLGMSVPGRVGTNVDRNYIKRLIREAFRLDQHELPQGIDYVVHVGGEISALHLENLRRLVRDATGELAAKLSRRPPADSTDSRQTAFRQAAPNQSRSRAANPLPATPLATRPLPASFRPANQDAKFDRPDLADRPSDTVAGRLKPNSNLAAHFGKKPTKKRAKPQAARKTTTKPRRGPKKT